MGIDYVAGYIKFIRDNTVVDSTGCSGIKDGYLNLGSAISTAGPAGCGINSQATVMAARLWMLTGGQGRDHQAHVAQRPPTHKNTGTKPAPAPVVAASHHYHQRIKG